MQVFTVMKMLFFYWRYIRLDSAIYPILIGHSPGGGG